ncbi:N-acetyl-gamma-glutamyl-phosphate reductase [bacterium]|nr:N-acetyl-gamma-glutamyl-phosphate reductase [bacterium]
MNYKIFVDGQEGTTGLKIHDYLSVRKDIEVLKIDHDKRKDINAKRALLNEVDVVFLCLPDDAARESASLVTNPNTRVIDGSTAHRVDPDWVYGLPELNKQQRERIREAKRVTVPGCHATGFVIAMYPLVCQGIVPKDYPVVCHSITGYSGGGRSLIAQYETATTDPKAPKHYALGLNHKHLPEMQKVVGLDNPPVFTPTVADYYNGMTVSIPLIPRLLSRVVTPSDVAEILSEYYADEKFIQVMPADQDSIDTLGCNGTNRVELFVFGNKDRILLISRLDNLGKGASGAAVQNMNIMLGVDESAGIAC